MPKKQKKEINHEIGCATNSIGQIDEAESMGCTCSKSRKPKKVRIKGWIRILGTGKGFNHYDVFELTDTPSLKQKRGLLESGYRPAVLEIKQ